MNKQFVFIHALLSLSGRIVSNQSSLLGAIQVLRKAVGDGRVSDILEKKRYKDVRINVTSVTSEGG